MPKISNENTAENSKPNDCISTILKLKNNQDINYINQLLEKSNKVNSLELFSSNSFFPPTDKIEPQIQQEVSAKTASLPAQNTQIRREDIKPGDIIISVGSVDPEFSKEYLQNAFDEYREGSFDRLASLGSWLIFAQRLVSNSTGHNDSVHVGLCVGFDNEGSSYELVLKSEDNFLAPGKLYISIDKSNTYFDYFLFDPMGNRIEGKILIDDLTTLNAQAPFTILDLRAVKDEILAITLQRGHTNCKTPIIRDLHGRVQDMSIYKYYIPTTLRVFRPNLPSLLFEKATENILETQTEKVKTNWNNRRRCSFLKLSEVSKTLDNLNHSHYILVKNDNEKQFNYYHAPKDKLIKLYPTEAEFIQLEELFDGIESGEKLSYYELITIDEIIGHSHLKHAETDRFYMPGRYTSRWDRSAQHLLKIGLTPSNFFSPANMENLQTDKEMICSKLIIQSYKILLTHIARSLQIEDEHEFVRNYMNLMDNSLPKTLEGYLKGNVNYVEMIIPTHFNSFDRIGEILEREGANYLQVLYEKFKESSDDQYVKATKFVDEANRLELKMPEQLKTFLISQAIMTTEKSQKGSHHNLAQQYQSGKELFETILSSEVMEKSPELKKVQAQIKEQSNQYSALWQHHESKKGFMDRNFDCEASTLAKIALITGGLYYLTSGF